MATTSQATRQLSERERERDIQDRIRLRAYERYLERRGTSGSPEEDWLQAEQEIAMAAQEEENE